MPSMEPATGSALIGGLKALYDMVKANKDPGLMTKLTEIQGQVFELMNDNQTLRERSTKLGAALNARAETELRSDGAIWLKSDKAVGNFGGYCPNCHADGGKLLKLVISHEASDSYRHCSICKFQATGRWWRNRTALFSEGVYEAVRLVDLSGIEPLTSCMPCVNSDKPQQRQAQRHQLFGQSQMDRQAVSRAIGITQAAASSRCAE